MDTTNYTTSTTGNDAAYVSENQLSDAAMFIQAAMRLVDMKDAEAFILLGKAMAEIIAAQDYLEAMDPVESPIDGDIAAMLSRIGLGR